MDIIKGDIITLWNGARGFVHGASQTHVSFTAFDDPRQYRIPVHNAPDTIIEVKRNGARIWPPESVQLGLWD